MAAARSANPTSISACKSDDLNLKSPVYRVSVPPSASGVNVHLCSNRSNIGSWLLIVSPCGRSNRAIVENCLRRKPVPTVRSVQIASSVRRRTRVAIIHGMNSGYFSTPATRSNNCSGVYFKCARWEYVAMAHHHSERIRVTRDETIGGDPKTWTNLQNRAYCFACCGGECAILAWQSTQVTPPCLSIAWDFCPSSLFGLIALASWQPRQVTLSHRRSLAWVSSVSFTR